MTYCLLLILLGSYWTFLDIFLDTYRFFLTKLVSLTSSSTFVTLLECLFTFLVSSYIFMLLVLLGFRRFFFLHLAFSCHIEAFLNPFSLFLLIFGFYFLFLFLLVFFSYSLLVPYWLILPFQAAYYLFWTWFFLSLLVSP